MHVNTSSIMSFTNKQATLTISKVPFAKTHKKQMSLLKQSSMYTFMPSLKTICQIYEQLLAEETFSQGNVTSRLSTVSSKKYFSRCLDLR